MQERTFIESRDEMEAILRQETIGYLGVSDNGSPYVVPLNHAYVDGRILFHGAFDGKKMESLRQNPQVCYTVAWQSGEIRRHGNGNPCHVDSDSVICYGTARIIDDLEERRVILDEFNRFYKEDAAGISLKSATNCAAVEIRITEMTGRREREREKTYWRYCFSW